VQVHFEHSGIGRLFLLCPQYTNPVLKNQASENTKKTKRAFVPFNPTLVFALPKVSFIMLKIYDLLGNEVATLVAEKLPAGKHQRVWEARGLASGV